MGKIFTGKPAGSTSTSNSSNQAYGLIKDQFSPTMGFAQSGAQGIQQLLSGDSSGFDAYKGATGFDAAAEMGSRGITGNAAASGLLRSGSTAKGLQSFGNAIQNQYADNYMNRLLGLSGLGMQAGSLIAGAGQVSNSQSKQTAGKKGLFDYAANAAANVASGGK